MEVGVSTMPNKVFMVVTPEGNVSEPSCALRAQVSVMKYVQQWMPPKVSLSPYRCDALWEDFQKAGYRVIEVELPDSVQNLGICHT